LDVGKEFFLQDFEGLSASRNFESWWRDQLVSPFYCLPYLWSYQGLIPLIEECGCELYATSPIWAFENHFTWYKKILSVKERHQQILQTWGRMLPF